MAPPKKKKSSESTSNLTPIGNSSCDSPVFAVPRSTARINAQRNATTGEPKPPLAVRRLESTLVERQSPGRSSRNSRGTRTPTPGSSRSSSVGTSTSCQTPTLQLLRSSTETRESKPLILKKFDFASMKTEVDPRETPTELTDQNVVQNFKVPGTSKPFEIIQTGPSPSPTMLSTAPSTSQKPPEPEETNPMLQPVTMAHGNFLISKVDTGLLMGIQYIKNMSKQRVQLCSACHCLLAPRTTTSTQTETETETVVQQKNKRNRGPQTNTPRTSVTAVTGSNVRSVIQKKRGSLTTAQKKTGGSARRSLNTAQKNAPTKTISSASQVLASSSTSSSTHDPAADTNVRPELQQTPDFSASTPMTAEGSTNHPSSVGRKWKSSRLVTTAPRGRSRSSSASSNNDWPVTDNNVRPEPQQTYDFSPPTPRATGRSTNRFSNVGRKRKSNQMITNASRGLSRSSSVSSNDDWPFTDNNVHLEQQRTNHFSTPTENRESMNRSSNNRGKPTSNELTGTAARSRSSSYVSTTSNESDWETPAASVRPKKYPTNRGTRRSGNRSSNNGGILTSNQSIPIAARGLSRSPSFSSVHDPLVTHRSARQELQQTGDFSTSSPMTNQRSMRNSSNIGRKRTSNQTIPAASQGLSSSSSGTAAHVQPSIDTRVPELEQNDFSNPEPRATERSMDTSSNVTEWLASNRTTLTASRARSPASSVSSINGQLDTQRNTRPDQQQINDAAPMATGRSRNRAPNNRGMSTSNQIVPIAAQVRDSSSSSESDHGRQSPIQPRLPPKRRRELTASERIDRSISSVINMPRQDFVKAVAKMESFHRPLSPAPTNTPTYSSNEWLVVTDIPSLKRTKNDPRPLPECFSSKNIYNTAVQNRIDIDKRYWRMFLNNRRQFDTDMESEFDPADLPVLRDRFNRNWEDLRGFVDETIHLNYTTRKIEFYFNYRNAAWKKRLAQSESPEREVQVKREPIS
uniref:PWWP domain-containing protein n=1 Tax=Caenorhabditis tropicalis TaxID=1561998 RepID=A0A1I7TLP4_9PELO